MPEEAKAEQHVEAAAEDTARAAASVERAEEAAAAPEPGHEDKTKDEKVIDPILEAINSLTDAVSELCEAEMEREAEASMGPNPGLANTSTSTNAPPEKPGPHGTEPASPAVESGSVTVIETSPPQKVTLAQAAASAPRKRSPLRKFLFGRNHEPRE